MRNPSVHIGMTLLSENTDGSLRVSTQYGLSYAGVDDMQATMIQDILANEFGEQFNELLLGIGTRMAELGYEVGISDSSATTEDIEKAKGLVKRKNKPV
jgi:hypothetical protein